MNIDNSHTKVTFSFSPADYFLVYGKDDRFGENGGNPVITWTLNPRIDMSYKGKEDQVAVPVLYLSDQEADACKNVGFDYFDDREGVEEKAWFCKKHKCGGETGSCNGCRFEEKECSCLGAHDKDCPINESVAHIKKIEKLGFNEFEYSLSTNQKVTVDKINELIEAYNKGV